MDEPMEATSAASKLLEELKPKPSILRPGSMGKLTGDINSDQQ